MLKHIWSVLCRKSIIDSETNNISLNDVLEQLIIDIKVKKEDEQKLNAINLPIEFEVVNMWFKSGKTALKASMSVDFINPRGSVVKNFIQEFEMTPEMRRMRTRVKILGMALDTSGDYLVKVSIKENGEKEYSQVAELPIEVHINKQIVTDTPN